jgi:protein-L-isoaspartate(D-aspartate) O-methyltransferase
MSNAKQARQSMVDGQVRVNDVTDRGIQAAMLAVERDLFVPKSSRASAYSDIDVQVAEGRYLMKPRDFAKILQALEVKPTDLVLDIGMGTGYSSAVLARLAETVVALEQDEELAGRAEKLFARVEADNVAVICGPFCAGLPDQGPFDVILVGSAVAETPAAWQKQLADGGRLGVIERNGAAGHVKIYKRSGGVIGSRVVFDAVTPFLPGFEPVRQFAL